MTVDIDKKREKKKEEEKKRFKRFHQQRSFVTKQNSSFAVKSIKRIRLMEKKRCVLENPNICKG